MSETREAVFRRLLEAHIYAEMSLELDSTQSSDLANDVRRDWLDRWESAQPEVPVSWDGLLTILEAHYPANVFTGESGDPGAHIIALTREVERLRRNA